MSLSNVQLRKEAETLALSLPALKVQTRAASAPYPGAAHRKKAGQGEQFWQYRRYMHGDSAAGIDWRRSARGQDYYIRETELETARTVRFWTDPSPGFDWSSRRSLPSKANRARLLLLCAGILLTKAGERIGPLMEGAAAGSGSSAINRLADALQHPTEATPRLSRPASLVILASDFYSSPDKLEQDIERLGGFSMQGLLLSVTDPVEHDFPFEGRVRFRLPGTSRQRLFGRAESLKDTYLSRFTAHQLRLDQISSRAGWRVVRHRTDEEAVSGASALHEALTSLDVFK